MKFSFWSGFHKRRQMDPVAVLSTPTVPRVTTPARRTLAAPTPVPVNPVIQEMQFILANLVYRVTETIAKTELYFPASDLRLLGVPTDNPALCAEADHRFPVSWLLRAEIKHGERYVTQTAEIITALHTAERAALLLRLLCADTANTAALPVLRRVADACERVIRHSAKVLEAPAADVFTWSNSVVAGQNEAQTAVHKAITLPRSYTVDPFACRRKDGAHRDLVDGNSRRNHRACRAGMSRCDTARNSRTCGNQARHPVCFQPTPCRVRAYVVRSCFLLSANQIAEIQSGLDADRQFMGEPSTQSRVVREYSPDGLECTIIYSNCPENEIGAAIQNEVSLAESHRYTLEWKVYGHDHPESLTEHLLAAGFEPEPRESVLVLPVTEASFSRFCCPRVRYPACPERRTDGRLRGDLSRDGSNQRRRGKEPFGTHTERPSRPNEHLHRLYRGRASRVRTSLFYAP